MNENDIRKIVRDELLANANSGTPIVPRHLHTGNDSPKINQGNLVINQSYVGSITMKQGTLVGTGVNPAIVWAYYTLPIPVGAKEVKFYGVALNITDSPHRHSMITGSANLGIGYQYVPDGTNNIKTGGLQQKQNIVQGCASISVGDGSVGSAGQPPSGGTGGAGGAGGTGGAYVGSVSNYRIAYASDESVPQIFVIEENTAYDNTTLTIRTAFLSHWYLQG